jgi:hypothetical protein
MMLHYDDTWASSTDTKIIILRKTHLDDSYDSYDTTAPYANVGDLEDPEVIDSESDNLRHMMESWFPEPVPLKSQTFVHRRNRLSRDRSRGIGIRNWRRR